MVKRRFGIEYERRKCLKCLEMFSSSGKGNRICNSCAGVNKYKRLSPPGEVGFNTVRDQRRRLKSI